MQSDWDVSAEAWIEGLRTVGDFGRTALLDRPMLATVRATAAQSMLDVGFGEWWFCQMMAVFVPQVVGLDPTKRLLEEARALGRGKIIAEIGTEFGVKYVEGKAEALPFAAVKFDLVVSYFSLIDIADSRAALDESARVLRPGGYLLIGNLNSWSTAAQNIGSGMMRSQQGQSNMAIANYLTEHCGWAKWRGLRVKNRHRPLSQYIQEALQAGLRLVDFQEPVADAGWARSESYNHAPYMWLQLWCKPR